MANAGMPGGRPAAPVASVVNFISRIPVRRIACALAIASVGCLAATIANAQVSLAQPASLPAKAEIEVAYGGLPPSFEPNLGQLDRPVHLLSRESGYALSLRQAVLALQRLSRTAPSPESIARQLAEANTPAGGLDPQERVLSYVAGNDSAREHTGSPVRLPHTSLGFFTPHNPILLKMEAWNSAHLEGQPNSWRRKFFQLWSVDTDRSEIPMPSWAAHLASHSAHSPRSGR